MTGLRTRRSVASCAYYTRTVSQMVRDAFLVGAGIAMLLSLVAAALLWPEICRAEGWYLQAHGASLHASRRDDGSRFNGVNVGVGLEYETSREFAYSTGAYRNSIDRTTVYALVRWTPVDVAGWRAGVAGGVVTGYAANHGGPTPAVALAVVSPEIGRVSVQLVGMPGGVHPKVVGFVGLSVRVRL